MEADKNLGQSDYNKRPVLESLVWDLLEIRDSPASTIKQLSKIGKLYNTNKE